LRRIYLVRHALPNFENGIRICLGQGTDLPLSPEGLEAAKRLYGCGDGEFTLFASPLTRCRQTAECLSGGRWPINILNDMKELDCGEWEGLNFQEIKERYADLFEARKDDMSIPPAGGETYEHGAERAMGEIRSALASTEGDLIIVAHAGINRAVLCTLMGIPMSRVQDVEQDYACINVLECRGDELAVTAYGRGGDDTPDAKEMYTLFGTPEHVIAHCRAVRDAALELSRGLDGIDENMLECACLIHDMCRTESDHASLAAEKLRSFGYPKLANIVAAHHDCPVDGGFDEKKLLFLADKLVCGTERVTLKERFERSRGKCGTPAALEAWQSRRNAAFEIMKQYNEVRK